MRDSIVKITIVLVLISGSVLAGQDMTTQEPPQTPAPEPVFVRLTLYPTASLSRYDFNNDIDLYEVRAYAEIRKGSQVGEAITGAKVTVLSEALELRDDHYEKRITIPKDRLPMEVEVSIALKGRPPLNRVFSLPSWLIIDSPKPSVIESARDLVIAWRFTGCPETVNIRVYDFKTGNSISTIDGFVGTELVAPEEKIPSATIIRIYVISSWISKQYLGGPEFVRGSEINVIPWSQVFVRTKDSP